MLTKLGIVGAIILMVILAIWRYNIVIDQRDDYKNRMDVAISTLDESKKELIAANEDRSEYLTQLEIARNEAERLETCIADRTCVPTIRVRVPATCPATSEGSAPRAESVSYELDPVAGRAYTNLRAGIKQLEADHALCLRTLRRWASPDEER